MSTKPPLPIVEFRFSPSLWGAFWWTQSFLFAIYVLTMLQTYVFGQAVEGRVIKSAEVIWGDPGGRGRSGRRGQTWIVDVEVEYLLNGRRVVTDRVYSGGRCCEFRALMERRARELTAGTSVPVYVNGVGHASLSWHNTYLWRFQTTLLPLILIIVWRLLLRARWHLRGT